jgi:hypothetical protein
LPAEGTPEHAVRANPQPTVAGLVRSIGRSRSAGRESLPPGGPDKPEIVADDIVADYGVRTDRNVAGIWRAEVYKLDLVLPYIAQKILEHIDRKLLARATPIADAERANPA